MEAMNQSGLILIERQMEHCLGQQQTITSDIARLKAEISQLERVRDSIRFYPRIIVDSWDYNDDMGIELLDLAELYKRWK